MRLDRMTPTRPQEPTFRAGMTWTEVREQIGRVASQSGEWCGLPLPVEGLRLQIEPRNPWAEKFAKLFFPREDEGARVTRAMRSADEFTDEAVVVNTWWSRRLRARVVIWRDGTERGYLLVEHDIPAVRWRQQFGLIEVAAGKAWSLEAELTAVERLETLIAPHLLEMYAMTGMFLETSRRSGLVYIFRRSRPTIVLTMASGRARPLCALCLHPIGYYTAELYGTWAGAMVPTDDVIAHLLLMRADEQLYWRRANQHALDRPEAGL